MNIGMIKMNKKSININGLSGILLMGASALVLSACVPEDEVASQEQDVKRVEAMATSYAQAFEHYSNQALNAVVNSTAWQAQLLPEGSLDLSEAQFGGLNLGQAEGYIQSAHCNIGDDAYHLTWFDKQDSDGDLFLKGLGAKQSGLVSLKIKDIIPNQNFGVMTGSSIAINDGASTLSLSGGCSTINIPEGSAVAAIRIPAPVQVTETQEKFITRAASCGANEEGGILQRVDASFTEAGDIVVQGRGFDSEADVIADNTLTWNEISNECIALNESVTRVVQPSTADAVNMASLSGLSGGIANTLRSNLNDLECKDVKKKENPEKGENNDEFDTCEDAGALDLLDGMSADQKKLVSKTLDPLENVCPAQPDAAGTVTIDISHNDFTGVHNALNNKQASFSFGQMTGQMTLNKITRVYEVMNDYGGDTGSQTDEVEVISHEGVSIECSRPNALRFTCNQMFPDKRDPSSNFNGSSNLWTHNNGLDYTRRSSVSGWANASTMTPNDAQYNGQWSDDAGDNMFCRYQIQRSTNTRCGVHLEGRRFEATEPDNGRWNEWHTVQAPGRYVQRPNPALPAWQAELDRMIEVAEALPEDTKERTKAFKEIDRYTRNAPSDTVGACEEPSSASGPGSSGSGSGGSGGKNCFVAGTLVAMADGSTKRVENVQIGDETISGRVLHKYARGYEEALAYTDDGIIGINGGLFEYDGVITTGQHPIHLDGKWQKLGDYSEAIRHEHNDTVKTVYNFLTESHVVPVVGTSGTVYDTADDLNNIDNTAEKGRLKALDYLRKRA